MFAAETHHIRIEVTPAFLDEQSEPSENRYVWSYTIRISNQGEQQVQLVSRYWHITDAIGQVHEVQGEGVVGEKPVLDPGDEFEYTSGTPLSTASGIMCGHFMMHGADGNAFKVDVPAFSLDCPYEIHSLN